MKVDDKKIHFQGKPKDLQAYIFSLAHTVAHINSSVSSVIVHMRSKKIENMRLKPTPNINSIFLHFVRPAQSRDRFLQSVVVRRSSQTHVCTAQQWNKCSEV